MKDATHFIVCQNDRRARKIVSLPTRIDDANRPFSESPMKFNSLLISPDDNTVTLLAPCAAGDELRFAEGGGVGVIRAQSAIPFGHKAARRAIHAGEEIIKYDEVIGTASADIAVGEHVHTQNVKSTRGRGDLGTEAVETERVAVERTTALLTGKPVVDASKLTFRGYPRPDGSAGIRNYVAVVACVVCVNDVVLKLGDMDGVAVFTHQQGCCQTGPDISAISEVLTNLAFNPNVGAILYVSLGCESVQSQTVLAKARASGKPAELLVIQEEGGASKTLELAKAKVEEMKKQIACEPVDVPFSKLKLGLKCGSSDTTQGLSANVIAGMMTDIFVAAGASVVMGETTEFMGAEHIAARRAANQQTADAIEKAVADMEARAKAIGVDMRGGQPTRGNIAGGLTTIEEKSLGALVKSGTAVFQDVLRYGERRSLPGLVMMDSPGREPEILTGLASAGCSLVIFTTGRGAPQGFPFMPVIKVTGNSNTWKMLSEHIDSYVGGIMDGEVTNEEAAKAFFNELLEFVNGRKTRAEECRYYNSMNIYVTGPVI